MDIQKILMQPKTRIKLTFSSTVLIVFFYLIFRPFQMAKYEMHDFLLVNGAYLVLSLLIISLHLIAFPIVFKEKFQNIISKKQNRLLFLLWIIFTLGVSFFIFKIAFGFYNLSIDRIITGILAFFALSVFPILVLKIADTEKLNLANTDKVFVDTVAGEINSDDILYILSDKNYVVWVCLFNGRVEEIRVRETLRSVLDRLQGNSYFIQTHRAFLVNRTKIKKINKNSGSYIISLKGCDNTIPLSRGFRSLFPSV